MPVADLLGQTLPQALVTIERGPVEQFARAVHDPNPVYFSAAEAGASGFGDVPIPPTYLFAAQHWGAFAELQPQTESTPMSLVELIAALRDGKAGMILHGGQEFEYLDSIWVGDTLEVRGVVESAETKPSSDDGRAGMSVLVVRTEYRRRGQASPAAIARSTYLFRPCG